MSLFSLFTADALPRSLVVLIAVGAVATYDILQRSRNRRSHTLFACVLGTVLSLGLIRFGRMMLAPGIAENAHLMALGVLLLVLGWNALFGPWDAPTKATILGTFIFWVTESILSKETPSERMLQLIAAAVALIPAAIWCLLFLRYHRERISRVLLLFFGGMISTIPILFYDALVRQGSQLQFFLFKIVPESFSTSSQSFVTGQLTGLTMVNQTIVTTLLSFLIVGIIEECSKAWVVKKSGEAIFTSIDDALQLSIIAAIGFSFAENIVNPTYFMAFVQDYLLIAHPDIGGFVSNVAGRAILTTMVHIVSTGVMGYFLGQALFSAPVLEEERKRGRLHLILGEIETVFGVSKAAVYRWIMLWSGILAAIALHASFDFLVTFPDLLPGHPHTLGQLFELGHGSFLNAFPLLLFPALFYVVGGFWLLSMLFDARESMEERGHLVRLEAFVREAA